MLCASYSINPREGQYWPVIDYVIIVDTQHTNILINTDRISESQKIDKNSALICSGKLSDIINIKKIYAWPSLLHFEFELNMSSSDDLLSQALLVFIQVIFQINHTLQWATIWYVAIFNTMHTYTNYELWLELPTSFLVYGILSAYLISRTCRSSLYTSFLK